MYLHACRCCGFEWTSGDPKKPHIAEPSFCRRCADWNESGGTPVTKPGIQLRTETVCQHGRPIHYPLPT